jgi:hypothetical protein
MMRIKLALKENRVTEVQDGEAQVKNRGTHYELALFLQDKVLLQVGKTYSPNYLADSFG